MRLHLLQKVLRLPQAALKRAVTGLLQFVLLVNRPARLARSGFVLPTTVLLVLMVVLTATALTYRSFTRSDMAISQREQQVISNAATPAIDRAKAKIEFLFQTDKRLSSLPASDNLADLMLVRSDFDGWTGLVPPLAGADDPYTLPDETRIDINRDGELDNAWSFKADVDGKDDVGDSELIVYSILVDDAATPAQPNELNPSAANFRRVDGLVDQTKADALVTRTGPLAVTEASPSCVGARAEGGWQVVQQGDNSTLQKNFQVNAFVANANDVNRTFETLEFQQSRSAARANKWGAWFRYDLDLTPGPEFNWNGAMHTDGSFYTLAGSGTGAGQGYRSHMVSSHNSCVYSQAASEISLSEVDLIADNKEPVPGRVVNGQQEFQGQAVRGALRFDNNLNAGSPSIIHVWNGDGQPAKIDLTLDTNTDSVKPKNNVTNFRPSDVAINPLVLFTRDVTEHINPSTWERDLVEWGRDGSFKDRERIINDEVARPFVDDFFRADNRWGPKPRYDSRDPDFDMVNVTGAATGNNIVNSTAVAPPNNPINVGRLTQETEGLDGYWERQANTAGMKLIVGERLELGNANGWNSSPIGALVTDPNGGDPLYPAKIRPAVNNRYGLAHEYLQRRSLRDNLAAVQGMVVYHYRINDGQFPAACVALTAHPGTQASIVQSRTFTNWLSGDVKTSFLTGIGTNGWEFGYNTSFQTEDDFKDAYNLNSSPLKKALSNLAYFAGDPSGGAPSFPPVQDSFVHPYSYLSMWGDFSVLRRILSSPYDETMSPADKSTLHSAACTLGLLAYNLDKQKADFDGITSIQWANDTNADGVYESGIAKTLFDLVGTSIPVAGVETANWLQAAAADPNINQIQAASEYFQIQRDRTFGFLSGQGLDAVATPTLPGATYNQATATFTFAGSPPAPYTATSYRVGCDPNLFVGKGITSADVDKALTLALALCPKPAPATGTSVKYPSLYYLFPRASHNQYETAASADLTSLGITGTTAQPVGEEFIDATAPVTPDNITTYTVSHNYEVIDSTNPDDLSGLAAKPRTPGATTDGWQLPYTANSTGVLSDTAGNRPDDKPFAITNPAGGTLNVSFLDKGLYNGREQLNTRVLDIDLEAITRNRTQASGGDYWLSADLDRQAEGVVYAFREDAVREDEIVRPKNATATVTADFCQTLNTATPRRFNIETQANCRMRVEPGTAPVFQDPPLTGELVSLKPVDFFPDPERRAHGFRLRTASGAPADFSGGNTAEFPTGRRVGMTFVTDNSVYIQGNFNPHSPTGQVTDIIEEFKAPQTLYDKTLVAAFGLPFYNDRTAANLNLDNFATLAKDHWRPVEILADAITILSGNFRDGALVDGFTQATPPNEGGGTSSYMNQNRPTLADNLDDDDWVRENTAVGSPVWVDRNGTYYRSNSGPSGALEPFYSEYDANDRWTNFTRDNERRRDTQRAATTFVNATFVSGLVPQRPLQGYGGLHNFLRFLEAWRGIDLHIAGSLIQLNFSTNATGPFEHDAWHPTQDPDDKERLGYYVPPNRRWGYDVALLYVPPAPAARRFVNIGAPRSEYYRELPADDPYIVNLRCAQKKDETFIFDDEAIRGTCPT